MSIFLEGEAEDTRTAIMQATYGVLREHGYAGLTVSRIASRAGLSKSSLYTHYDGKEDLLGEFMAAVVREFVDAVDLEASGDPERSLLRFLSVGFPEDFDRAVVPGFPSGEPYESFVELRAQAVHDEEFRAEFASVDARLTEHLKRVIEEGIERGHFEPVPARSVAETLVTLVMGGVTRRATSDEIALEGIRDEIEWWLSERLGVENALS